MTCCIKERTQRCRSSPQFVFSKPQNRDKCNMKRLPPLYMVPSVLPADVVYFSRNGENDRIWGPLEIIYSALVMFGSDVMKQMQLKRFLHALCGLGFLILFGTANASDLNSISISRTFWQSFVGLTMFIVGGTLGGLIEW